MRIVVLGGGFGGVVLVRHLEKVLGRRTDVEITLVSRQNFFMLTPLLFEACSGRLELRHCAQPIRAALSTARFIEATVESVDVDAQRVRAVSHEGNVVHELPYDHLVVALGASTNDNLIPGSSSALTFKTMADALVLRNHLIQCFEHADAATEATERRACLSIAAIGGGLVGVELIGELTAFADDVLRYYPRIRRDEVRFWLFEAGPRILPELDERLAAKAARVLEERGVTIHVSTPVRSIDGERVQIDGQTIVAGTVVLTAGIVPSAVASAIAVVRDHHGRIAVDATMRSRSHAAVWALGDCAAIPGPDGRRYPALAQHAVREGRHLARNIEAVIEGRAPTPFTFRALGTMASLGHTSAVALAFGVHLTGFIAWWLRRTYYLFQMPRWDRRLRIVLDWTVALFFRPDITRVDLRVEREQVERSRQLVASSGLARALETTPAASRTVTTGESPRELAEL
jgi:NADH dehydrogenase